MNSHWDTNGVGERVNVSEHFPYSLTRTGDFNRLDIGKMFTMFTMFTTGIRWGVKQ